MTDIVEQVYEGVEWAYRTEIDGPHHYSEAPFRAADEIERLRAAAVGIGIGTEPAAWRLVSPEGTTVLWSERKDALESERAKYWPHCRVEPLFAMGTGVETEAVPAQD